MQESSSDNAKKFQDPGSSAITLFEEKELPRRTPQPAVCEVSQSEPAVVGLTDTLPT
jgi:hypothetical protein